MMSDTDSLFQDIADHAPGVIYHYRLYPDGQSCFPFASEGMKRICGVFPAEVIHDATPAINLVHPDDLDDLMSSISISATTLTNWSHEYRVMPPGENGHWVLGHASPRKLEDGSILWSGFITNISERKKLSDELLKTARLYAVTAQINQMVLHCKKQEDVFRESCRIAVEEGKFQMAWVALINQEQQFVSPSASFGNAISCLEDMPSGEGPIDVAISEKRSVWINDFHSGNDFPEWRKKAIEHGFASCIALPIWLHGSVIGSFNLYSSQSNFYNVSEIQLLEKVASNISFAIEAIDNEIRHKQSEQLLEAITTLSPDVISILSETGQIIFNSPAALRIHGYTNKELLGKNYLEMIHPDDQAESLKSFQDLLDYPGLFVNVQHRYLNKDQSYTWMEATALNQVANPQIHGVLTISRDISNRKKLEEDLKLALAMRDEFLLVASHELKTPITSLKLQLQMLSREVRPAENILPNVAKLSKSLSVSTKQVDRITALVENLLDVTRIQAGKLNIKLEESDLSEALEDSLDRFGGLFSDAGCALKIMIEKNIIGVFDKSRIEQVFVNLLSNAIKYAPGEMLEISLTRKSEKAIFSVKDHGPGISSDKQNAIFERFARATDSRNISGLGLGLFISKEIVEAHRGVVRVESEPGLGARFIVELPLK
jgi:PAS domain S-box-containing protein